MEKQSDAGIWQNLPTLAWLLFALVVLYVFRKEIRSILSMVSFRIKSGGGLKIAAFELGPSYIPPSGDIRNQAGGKQSRVDESMQRYQQRKTYYLPNRNIHLVHRLSPSQAEGQLYDILLYLIPHKGATLASVQRVEYYFGRHWGNRVFTSIDRARGFAVSTSAFGPFMCTAEVLFTDSEKVMLNRYVDFEMGVIGKELPPQAEGK